MKKFIYLLCLIPVFNFLSVLQTSLSFNSIFKYIVPVLFFLVSLKLYFKYKPDWLLSGSDKLFYYALSGFTFYLVISSVRFELFYLQEFFVGEIYLLPYLLPIFLLNIKVDPQSLNIYFSIIKKFLLIGIFVLIYIIGNLNFENWFFHTHIYELTLFGFPIIFLLSSFLKEHKFKVYLYVIFALILFISSYYGRRSLFADLVLIFIFHLLIQIGSKSKSRVTLFLKYLVVTFMIIPMFIIYAPDLQQFSVFQRGFNKAGWEESRGQVLEEFFSDFGSDSDWFIGRGLNGTVQRSLGGSINGRGRNIENGYLMLILKGGNFYFLLILYFFLRAFYLGWFKSNNDFTKAFASLLLIHLIGMIGFNIPIFNHRYMLLWLSIPICFSVYYRNLSNEQIKQLIIS